MFYCFLIFVSCILNTCIVGNETAKFKDQKYASNIAFRNYENVPEGFNELEDFLNEDNHDGREETYYEPYWQNGQWVFLRLTTTGLPKSRMSKRPRLKPGAPPGVRPPKKHVINGSMSLYRDCNVMCMTIYRDVFGPVCGQRFNTNTGKWQYEHKWFPSMCDLERENCKTPSKRPMWYPLHRGTGCVEMTTFKLFPADSKLILERKSTWAPFEFELTTTTMSRRPTRKQTKSKKSKGPK